MNNDLEGDSAPKLLRVVAELMRGTKHSRQTVASTTGRSLSTADRWLEHIASILPGMRREKGGADRRTTWLVHEGGRERPSRLAVVGACVAASLASLFEGTQHERNLKDARDYLLRERGETYGDLDRKFVFAPRGGEYALPEAAASLDEVIGALLKGRILRFLYGHNDGHREVLTVEPLSLVLFDHQFYVLARRTDGSLYCYRFARMSDVDETDTTFEYPSKNEFQPRNVLESGFGVHISGVGPVEDVAVVLRGPWAKFAKTHRWHPTQQVVPHPDGTVTVKFRVRVCPEVQTWVLGFGEYARVTQPPALRDEVARRFAEAAQIYVASPPRETTLAKPSPVSATKRTKRAPGG